MTPAESLSGGKVVHMFDSVADLDAAATVAGCEVSQRTVVVESCRTLVLAAHWADLHPGEAIPVQRVPGRRRHAIRG